MEDYRAGGSSPQARGAQHDLRAGEDPGGLIPAGAGSTAGISMQDAGAIGSSPQARGARGHRHRACYRQWLIPAGAGSTYGARTVSAALWGSSPQARGAQLVHVVALQFARLIPAGAGSTDSSPLDGDPPWAHPRRRGEHVAPAAFTWTCTGSSPQARGAHEWWR